MITKYRLVKIYDYYGYSEPRLEIYKYEDGVWYWETNNKTWRPTDYQKEDILFMWDEVLMEDTDYERVLDKYLMTLELVK